MKRFMCLLFAAALIYAIVPTDASLAEVSAGVAEAEIQSKWVPPGSHGDVFDHYSSGGNGYGDPPKTSFGLSDPLWLHTYVHILSPCTVTVTHYLFNITTRELGKAEYEYNIGSANDWLFWFGWSGGIEVAGEYIYFAKISTGTTKDWGLIPLARFSVSSP
jgi:hypothetical protein